MFKHLKNLLTRKPQRQSLRGMHVPLSVNSRYDAAATTQENRRHWAYADLLSAGAANGPQVRRVLRSRARYEVANNSYARGIALTLANDCVGTGPILQMLTDDADVAAQCGGELSRSGKGVRDWSQAEVAHRRSAYHLPAEPNARMECLPE